MSKLIWILGDQLNEKSNLFKDFDKDKDICLFIESLSFASQHKHHKKKLIFQFSAMRHFAKELKAKNYEVEYINLESELGKKDFLEALKDILTKTKCKALKVMKAADYDCRVLQESLADELKAKIEIVPNDLFLTTESDLKANFEGKKNFLMETYYRFLRRKHKVLLESDGKPLGGKWNFDKENRKPLKGFSPKLISHTPQQKPDKITEEVIKTVTKLFPDHYGSAENFNYCVNRKQALAHLENFMTKVLPNFGDYQDAMSKQHWHLFHALISYLMNFGLLHPMEVIRRAEEEYYKSNLPLNAVEGFIRQILGWREYVYAIYSLKMPDYRSLNHFVFTRKMPAFMWTGETKMNCLKYSIEQTIEHAYAHHIQRLMVIGNFCLLAGINPQEVCEWYLIVYIDALEWVELPNTLGMSQYGDGGIVGTKPYISSGKYINRMSDYCKSCHYDVDETHSELSCPFNYLYWNFLLTHQEKLKNNPRMGIALKNLLNKSPDEMKQIKELSEKFLSSEEMKIYALNLPAEII